MLKAVINNCAQLALAAFLAAFVAFVGLMIVVFGGFQKAESAIANWHPRCYFGHKPRLRRLHHRDEWYCETCRRRIG